MIIYIYKDYGITPNELINSIKSDKKYEKYKDKKMSFAGRLDPMACGIMMICVDDSCLKQDLYIKHDKIYNFKLVIGLSTDSHDILGEIIDHNLDYDFSTINEELIKSIIYKFSGIQDQYFPDYCSKRIKGTPMWKLAQLNTLKNYEIPKKEINIYNIELLEKSSENIGIMCDYFIHLIDKVSKNQNFRQEKIKEQYKIFKKLHNKNKLVICSFQTHVSSGTYIRKLAHDIGKFINIPCLALNIERLKIIN